MSQVKYSRWARGYFSSVKFALRASEDVLYLDNYAMLLCFFEYWCICFSLDILWDICLWNCSFHPSNCCYCTKYIASLSLRKNLLVLARRIMAIVLLAKPFGSEKLNKRDFILLSSPASYHRDVLSPDLFSHGSRSSTSLSDLLKLPNIQMTPGWL